MLCWVRVLDCTVWNLHAIPVKGGGALGSRATLKAYNPCSKNVLAQLLSSRALGSELGSRGQLSFLRHPRPSFQLALRTAATCWVQAHWYQCTRCLHSRINGRPKICFVAVRNRREKCGKINTHLQHWAREIPWLQLIHFLSVSLKSGAAIRIPGVFAV